MVRVSSKTDSQQMADRAEKNLEDSHAQWEDVFARPPSPSPSPSQSATPISTGDKAGGMAGEEKQAEGEQRVEPQVEPQAEQQPKPQPKPQPELQPESHAAPPLAGNEQSEAAIGGEASESSGDSGDSYAQYLANLKTAEREFIETGMAVKSLKDQLKTAREIHSETADRLANLRASAYSYLQPHISAKEAELDPAAFLAMRNAADDLDGVIVDLWREVPIETLIGCGLAEKTVEKLKEAGVQSLGDYQYDAKYASIGQGKKDQIADAFEKFWERNPQFIKPEKPVKTEEKAEPEPESELKVKAEIEPAISPAKPPATEKPSAPLTEDQRRSQIDDRVKKLDNGKAGWLDYKHSLVVFDDGCVAFDKQKPIYDCPHEPGGKQDDWLRGWLAQELEQKKEAAELAALEKNEASEEPTKASEEPKEGAA